MWVASNEENSYRFSDQALLCLYGGHCMSLCQCAIFWLDYDWVVFVDSVAGECKKADTEPIRKKVVSLQNDLKVEMKRAKASGELEVKSFSVANFLSF